MSVPALKVNVVVVEISAPIPLVTVPLLEFALEPELLRLIAPVTAMEAPVPVAEIVLLLVLERVAPPVRFNALESVISAPVPPATVFVFELSTIPPLPVIPGLVKEAPVPVVTAPLLSLASVPPLATVLEVVTVIKDPVPDDGPLLLLVNEPVLTLNVVPISISLPTEPAETVPEFDCSAVPPVMPKLPVMSV